MVDKVIKNIFIAKINIKGSINGVEFMYEKGKEYDLPNTKIKNILIEKGVI